MASFEDIARQVRSRRRSLSLTQEQLADLAGTSARFVWSIEQGKASVRVDKLMDVLRVLGLELGTTPRSDR